MGRNWNTFSVSEMYVSLKERRWTLLCGMSTTVVGNLYIHIARVLCGQVKFSGNFEPYFRPSTYILVPS